METFIDSISWKCLLGKQAKNIEDLDGLYKWQVNNKLHFTTNKILTKEEIEPLSGYSFHYLTIENLDNIKQYKKITKEKESSVIIDLTKFNLTGTKYSGIRHSINSAKKHDLITKENLDNINDLRIMLKSWSNTFGDKYFRNFVGKNDYFYSNNLHKDCTNLFIYKDTKLVSFATATNYENSSYVMGKALANEIHGLSEYTDYLLYNKLINNNVKTINLGRASKGLLFYKMKFPGSKEVNHFNGKVL